MTTTADNHLTFLSFGELFQHLAERCAQAECSLLAFQNAPGGRDFQVTELVAGAERQLASELALFAREAPEKVLSTKIQYILAEPELQQPQTLAQALENVTAVNCQLAATLRDLAEKTAPDTLSDVIDALYQLVDAANRRISMIRTTAFDT